MVGIGTPITLIIIPSLKFPYLDVNNVNKNNTKNNRITVLAQI